MINYLYFLSIHFYFTEIEVHPYGSVHVLSITTLTESPNDAGLSHAIVANKDYLKYVIIVFRRHRLLPEEKERTLVRQHRTAVQKRKVTKKTIPL